MIRSAIALRFAALGCTCFVVACTSLPEIEANRCGNRVVDPGEDCDTFPDGRCIAAGSVGQCKFSCSSTVACDEGRGCGTDGVCRAPNADLTLASTTPASTPVVVTTADFDGNGRDDVVAVVDLAPWVFYFEGAAAPAKSLPLHVEPYQLAAGDLNGDARADLVSVTDFQAISVLRGGADRTFAPTPYSSIEVDPGLGEARLVSLDAMQSSAYSAFGQEILLFAGVGAWDASGFRSQQTPLFSLPITTDELAGSIRTGKVNLADPCEQLVYAARGKGAVHVTSPCRLDPVDGAVWNGTDGTFQATQSVLLPSGAAVAPEGIFLIQINADALLDIVVAHEDATLSVAFGVGDGTFHSDASTLPTQAGDGRTAPWTPPLLIGNEPGVGGKPEVGDGGPSAPDPCQGADPDPMAVLTMGHLDEDGVVDVVTRSGIYVSSLTDQSATPADVGLAGRWIAAAVADFNGNGIVDVLGIDACSGADFFNGVPSAFGGSSGRYNRFHIAVDGRPAKLTSGDFDGDLLLDAAIVTRVGNVDSLSILYGQPFGPPANPLPVGNLGEVVGLASGHLEAGGSDSVADLVVLSRSGTDSELSQTLATFTGSTDRRLQSPFRLEADFSYISGIVSGDFDGAGDARADVVAEAAHELVLLPSHGEAEIEVSDVVTTALPEDFWFYSAPMFEGVDLDDDGVQELVILGTDTSYTRGALLVARAPKPGDPPDWSFSSVQTTAETFDGSFASVPIGVDGMNEFGAPPAGEFSFAGAQPGAFIDAADVDGDGRRDIIAVGVDWKNYEAPQVARLLVFWNRGDGTLDVDDRLAADLPSALAPFATMQRDGDAQAEIVLLDGLGPLVFELVGDELENTAVLSDLGQPSMIATGDFDGDGIDDLAVSDTAGISIFTGGPGTQ